MDTYNGSKAPASSSMLDRFFGIRESGSRLRTEIVAGITTFLTAMYIIVVNPGILSQAGVPFASALTATVIVSFLGSCAMGLYARNPVLVAPGMGMNALFTFVMVHGGRMPWQTALGCVFWAGVIFAVLAAFNARKLVVDAIPPNLRHAVSCGIGLFICLIGLVNAKFVVGDPVTVVHASSLNPVIVTFLIGLAVTTVLVVRRVTGALMIGIVVTTVLAIPIGRVWGDGTAYWPAAIATRTLVNWNGLVSAPDFSGIGQLDLIGALKVAYWPFIFVMLFTAFFDALSTFMAISEAGNLIDRDGNPRNIRQSMMVDAFSAVVSAPLGTSPANAYIESAAGISAGGRTGLVAVVAGICFLPFLVLSPLLSLVPAIATAPALILVGVFMMESITKIEWHRFDEAIPAFIAMVLIPLTYSITDGIAYGFLAFVVLKLFTGKRHEIKPAMWIVAALSGVLLAQL
ncbi:NCS2 family permease [Burkholderia gladioli]|jgi:AGZA family xanthine/uracil permease-like MFS transporter|uniref:NCS2 family permease n=1 Tax=Burkholderia gladioli TaxID=28095 RepID=A0A095HAM5_BURGA|nr:MULTISPECIES: NCS2 family permease [Burkholderia]AJW97042.1 permease family protein [Burkholderia gladioli]ASD78367.1 NCS2 family permease [Burkholderia gladioli pv. gladioli]ATF85178.1 NCS2 family permease [Burkholderia gladioli pv. gladioli]AWY56388.1 NCS2 family permease [Burkholderia gladioli pv. gladioli]KAF1064487.1 Adenine permease AdeP [Burkholderia gladioli]